MRWGRRGRPPSADTFEPIVVARAQAGGSGAVGTPWLVWTEQGWGEPELEPLA